MLQPGTGNDQEVLERTGRAAWDKHTRRGKFIQKL